MNRNSHDAWKATLTIGLLIVGIGAVGLVIGYDRMAHDRNPGTGVIDEEESNVDLRTDRAFAEYIHGMCEIVKVDEGVVRAIIESESGWDAEAINESSGAAGLMQIVPSAWEQTLEWKRNEYIKRWGKRSFPEGFYKRYSRIDPKDNVETGIHLLRWLTQHYNGDLPSALLGYAWGYNAADRAIAEGYNPTDCEWVAKILQAAETDKAQYHYEARERVEK